MCATINITLTKISKTLNLQQPPQQPRNAMIVKKRPKKMRPRATPNRSPVMSSVDRSTVPAPVADADSWRLFLTVSRYPLRIEEPKRTNKPKANRAIPKS